MRYGNTSSPASRAGRPALHVRSNLLPVHGCCRGGPPRLGGAHDANGQALLAGRQQRLIHLVERLVERLHAAHALVSGEVAPAAAGVQEPLALVAVVLVPAPAGGALWAADRSAPAGGALCS